MKLLVSALEPSANIHLEPLLRLDPDIEISGIFDKRFGSPIYDMQAFSVMGFFDVISKIKLAKKALKEMTLLAKECNTVLLIDAPSFNLPLAKEIKKRYPDKKIVYYILPKVWAWKKGRVKKIDRYCDIQASIFPFEDRYFTNATYVGNPLLDEIKLRRNPTVSYKNIAFMPGSRRGEIKRLMPIFKALAKELESNKTIIVPPFLKYHDIKDLYGDLGEFDISYSAHETLAHSDFAFICSGTATLEAAIIGTPFVLAYKAKPIDFKIAKMFVKLPYVGLANLLLHFSNNPPMHTELLQDTVTVDNLLKAYIELDEEKFNKDSIAIRELLSHGSVKNLHNLL